VGSESECFGPGAAADGGAADAAAAVGAAGVAAADDGLAGGGDDGVPAAEFDAEAAADGVELPAPGIGPGVPEGTAAWSGVQALRAARPVPTRKNRPKARRLGASRPPAWPAGCRPDVSLAPL
jgi:hypothetical protein